MITRRRMLGTSLGFGAAAMASGRALAQGRTRMRIGVVPLLSSGPFFVALARGYFERAGIDVEVRTFADGALAIPALVAGELDATVATLNAGLFNAVSRGANYKLVLDRGIEKPGSGTTTILVSNRKYEEGVTGIDKFAMLRGARFAMQAPGGIDHYLLARALQNAGLDPRTGANYSSGLTYPDIIRSLGTGATDACQTPVPLAFLAETNNVGKIIGTGADIEPNCQLACWAMPQRFIQQNREVGVAFAMAHIHAARQFNAGAASKDADIMRIVNEATRIPTPLIERAAPRWTWYDNDGMPNTASVLRQVEFWTDTMRLVSGTVPRDALFDLGMAEEAARRLQSANPFG